MDPLTIALLASGAVSLGTGVAQYLNSSQAAASNKRETEALKKLVDDIQDPEFNVEDIPPAQLKVLQQFSPVIAQFVPQKSPELVKALSLGATRGRAASLNALESLESVARSGSDPLLDLQNAQAAQAAAAASGSAIASINQNMAQRGAGPGSGLGYAAALQQASSAQDALGQQGLQNNANAYQRRMAALQGSADLGSRMRQEDVSLEASNAQVLNDYNARMAAIGNEYNRYTAGEEKDARLFNLGQAQQVSDRNILGAQQQLIANRDYGNEIRQKQFQNKLGKLTPQFGISKSTTEQNTELAGVQNRGLQALGDGINTGIAGYTDYSRKPKTEKKL
jgi:hypothetical protein